MEKNSNNNCDKPEILEKFQGHCDDNQMFKCHGDEMLELWKATPRSENECDRPETLQKFNGNCSAEQTCECHRTEILKKWKQAKNL